MMRILVVDDNESIARLSVDLLNSAGYQADFACTLEEARKIIDEYEGFLIDVCMGDDIGLELIDSLPEGSPVAFVSGYNAESLSINELLASRPRTHFFMKPWRIGEVVKVFNGEEEKS